MHLPDLTVQPILSSPWQVPDEHIASEVQKLPGRRNLKKCKSLSGQPSVSFTKKLSRL